MGDGQNLIVAAGSEVSFGVGVARAGLRDQDPITPPASVDRQQIAAWMALFRCSGCWMVTTDQEVHLLTLPPTILLFIAVTSEQHPQAGPHPCHP